jgi:hypothetical protein
MRRPDLLSLVSMKATTFNVLQARGLLPFGANDRKQSWGSYSMHHAFRLMLFSALCGNGKSQIEAAATVRGQYDELLVVAGGTSGRPVWFGTFSVRAQAGGDPRSTMVLPLIGEFSNLETSAHAVLRRADIDAHTPTQFAAINATEIVRELIISARDFNLLEPETTELVAAFGVVL